jgi:hypothetical protein
MQSEEERKEKEKRKINQRQTRPHYYTHAT